MKSLHFLGLVALAAVALHGQTYYSQDPSLDCSGVFGPYPITNAQGATLGYSCAESGTFVWLAAGGPWGSSIRVAGPASGAIGVDYFFYDKSGNPQNLDTSGSVGPSSGNEVDFALFANQPAEIDLLGATSQAPTYSTTETGSIYAVIYCPDALTCEDVLPQLIYSALPTIPWSLAVPISWDNFTWTTWSAEGVDNGGSDTVSFVVYNNDFTPTSFNIWVYDSTGTLVASGATPVLEGLPTLSDGSVGEAQTFGDLLKNWVHPLPTGPFKVVFDGGSEFSSVEVLQFHGTSATTLEVAYEDLPVTASAVKGGATAKIRKPITSTNLKNPRLTSRSRVVFKPLPK